MHQENLSSGPNPSPPPQPVTANPGRTTRLNLLVKWTPFWPSFIENVLDEILRLYVEENLSARDIVNHGFDEKTVRWVQRRVDLNEYKREQAAPGLKVTSRAFGVGRRMPIAQKYVDLN